MKLLLLVCTLSMVYTDRLYDDNELDTILSALNSNAYKRQPRFKWNPRKAKGDYKSSRSEQDGRPPMLPLKKRSNDIYVKLYDDLLNLATKQIIPPDMRREVAIHNEKRDKIPPRGDELSSSLDKREKLPPRGDVREKRDKVPPRGKRDKVPPRGKRDKVPPRGKRNGKRDDFDTDYQNRNERRGNDFDTIKTSPYIERQDELTAANDVIDKALLKLYDSINDEIPPRGRRDEASNKRDEISNNNNDVSSNGYFKRQSGLLHRSKRGFRLCDPRKSGECIGLMNEFMDLLDSMLTLLQKLVEETNIKQM